MNINEIKDIIDLPGMSDEYKRILIIEVMAKDEKAIPDILDILAYERKSNKELTTDMNVLLSKAHLGLETPKLNKGGFMQKEIIEFYRKYRNKIGHCFKNLKFDERGNTLEEGPFSKPGKL